MKNSALQRHRINRAMNFARANIAEQLDVGAMADVACLSKFHFSRLFSSYFDETPSQFLARVRLETAARQLVYQPNDTVTDIAFECGFSGSDAFARSFRSRFGSAPRQFRTFNDPSFTNLEQRLSKQLGLFQAGTTVSPSDANSLRVRIEHRPSYHTAYVRHIGPYGNVGNSITSTFAALQRWANLRGVVNSRSSYVGVCPDNNSITPAHYCVYDVCIVLEDQIVEDDIVSVQTIPEGKFAVLSVACPAQQLNRMWSWLHTDWLPNNGTRNAASRSYEFFSEYGTTPAAPETGVELCLPLAA